MGEYPDPSLFQIWWGQNVYGKLSALIIVGCTLFLISVRIRGFFRVQPLSITRDLASLLAGPVIALLYSAMQAMAATEAYFGKGLDSEFGFLYGLRGPVVTCAFAFLGFLAGVIALMLPQRRGSAE